MTEQANRPHAPRDAQRSWLDDPQSGRRLIYVLFAASAILLAFDLAIPKKGPFGIEHLFGFYGIFGFIASIALVFGARALRAVVKRPEDYYDR